MSISKFTIGSFLIAVTLATIVGIINIAAGAGWSIIALSVAIVLALSTTIVAYLIVYTGIHQSAKNFTAFLLGSMLLKMIIGIISVAIVAILFKPFLKTYVIMYFISYFIFTSFEVYGLIRKLRQQN